MQYGQLNDYYNILNISRDATPEEMRKAYRKLVKEHHPDLTRNPGELRRRKEFLKLLNLAYEILNAKGYKVLTASNAVQALAELKKESIDLIVSDVIMPHMDGYQLAAHVQQQYPHIKIQIASGYESDLDEFIEDSTLRENILHKPYNAFDLLVHVRNLLDEDASVLTPHLRQNS